MDKTKLKKIQLNSMYGKFGNDKPCNHDFRMYDYAGQHWLWYRCTKCGQTIFETFKLLHIGFMSGLFTNYMASYYSEISVTKAEEKMYEQLTLFRES